MLAPGPHHSGRLNVADGVWQETRSGGSRYVFLKGVTVGGREPMDPRGRWVSVGAVWL